MAPSRRYKQLRFSLESTRQQYHYLYLRFRLGRHWVEGELHGDCSDWYFISYSTPFVKLIPSGLLRKYMLWIDAVPHNLSEVYNAIAEATAAAGYSMMEKEEC